jgi:TrmH family RNA methyltransferase
MTVAQWKDNVSFVLVEPAEWGNVGSSARAMKNMGFKHLCLVNPPEKGREEAQWFARNAKDVLGSAAAFATVDEALRDKAAVVGTTRRRGKRRGAVYGPSDGAEKIAALARKNRVALLFGTERTGLTNEEIEKCDFLITIPAERAQPSLNLAHAVLVLAYELSRADRPPAVGAPALAGREEVEALYIRMGRVLGLLGYGRRGDRDLAGKILSGMRRMVGRAGLTPWEAEMLHGLCSRLERRLGQGEE